MLQSTIFIVTQCPILKRFFFFLVFKLSNDTKFMITKICNRQGINMYQYVVTIICKKL